MRETWRERDAHARARNSNLREYTDRPSASSSKLDYGFVVVPIPYPLRYRTRPPATGTAHRCRQKYIQYCNLECRNLISPRVPGRGCRVRCGDPPRAGRFGVCVLSSLFLRRLALECRQRECSMCGVLARVRRSWSHPGRPAQQERARSGSVPRPRPRPASVRRTRAGCAGRGRGRNG